MRVNEINAIFKTLFKHNLHVELELVAKLQDYTDEFLAEYKRRWLRKEVPIMSLQNTILDTNNWQIDGDLCISLLSPKVFNQVSGRFEQIRVLSGDFEHKLKSVPKTRVFMLLAYMSPEEQTILYSYMNNNKLFNHGLWD